MILLIDGHHAAYRMFFKLKLATSRGVDVSIPYGCMVSIKNLLTNFFPAAKAVAWVWDGGSAPWRRELLPGYRVRVRKYDNQADKERWDTFYDQVNVTSSLLMKAGICQFRFPSTEGDDVISTIAGMTSDAVVVVSADKDFFQLASKRVLLFNPINNRLDNGDTMWERFGVTPAQYGESRYLSGDDGDGIPGIPGVGEKTAIKLVKTYGSAADVLRCAPKGEIMRRIQADPGTVIRNRMLMRLKVFDDIREKVLAEEPPVYDSHAWRVEVTRNEMGSIVRAFSEWESTFGKLVPVTEVLS